MTGRVQTARSNVSGNRPTGRQPGELYVNWADSQIGVVNNTGAAQDFVAVRFFNTAAAYAIGDFVIQAGQLYRAIAASPGGAFTPANWVLSGGSVWTADTPPATPQIGTLWYDSVGGQLYIYYNDGNTTQWVAATNQMGGGYLPLIGGTLTGDLHTTGDYFIDGAAASTRSVSGTTNGTMRWGLELGNNIAESGADAGSNFVLRSYDDSGANPAAAFSIVRSTSLATLAGTLVVNGSLYAANGSVVMQAPNTIGKVIYGFNSTNAAPLWSISLGDTTSQSGSNAGANFGLNRYNDAGTYLNSPITIVRNTGVITFNNDMTSGGGATFTGRITANGAITSFPNVIAQSVGGIAGYYIFSSGGSQMASVSWDNAGNNFNMSFGASYVQIIGSSGFFSVSGATALKPGGGTWTAPSDDRIKTVLGEYTLGLDEVLGLRPVTFVYKGNDTQTEDVNAAVGLALDEEKSRATTAPYPASPHYAPAVEGTEFVGFIAQELETIFPDMVSQNEGYIDGEKVTDLRNVDTSRLIYALVNAVKTLSARVATLEAGAVQ